MQVNEGMIDRIIRLIISISIIIAFLMGLLPGYWSLLLILSGTMLITATTGYCPLYVPIGMNTCKKK